METNAPKKFLPNSRYIISCDNWFLAPNGKEYRAVWGSVEIISDSFLGIKTNHHSSNWFAMVGSEYNHVIIAGCQIHYAVKCDAKPCCDAIDDWLADATNGIKEYKRPTKIYIAE